VIYASNRVHKWLAAKQPALSQKLEASGVVLEVMLSSPMMGLFANIVNLEVALRILDRFMMWGEDGII
jgi:hypothetical protein